MIVKDLSNSFNPVPKSGLKNVRKEANSNSKNVIKKKSSKLAKLERQRDKDLIKYGECEYCHKKNQKLDPHEVYGGSNRQRSIKYKFVKLLCRTCHSDESIIQQLKIDVQKEFEKENTREKFIEIIGQSYIGGTKNGVD